MTHAMSRLGAMMFLQFFIWGAWFVTLGTYLVQGPLQASASQVATAFLSQSIGAIVAPFLVGLIADRYFAAQRILAVLHLAGAVLMWLASTATSWVCPPETSSATNGGAGGSSSINGASRWPSMWCTPMAGTSSAHASERATPAPTSSAPTSPGPAV